MSDFKPLQLKTLSVWPPVVLAPMAGITNAPFRSLCREFGGGLYVSEMVTSRALVEKDLKSQKIASFGEDEITRSIQLYGVDPHFVGRAVKRCVEEIKVHHIDINFGCPVKKITRKGGGAALPLRPKLAEKIIQSAVENAGDIPVTVKTRIGINDELVTFKTLGTIAEQSGASAIGLHARTAEQFYSGQAQWEKIAELKHHVAIPVLGNGDIWEAKDAIEMMHQTGCDGVIVGRGCLGRPWLFKDLEAAFNGQIIPEQPNLGQVIQVMLKHAKSLIAYMGEENAMRAFRKHSSWYIKGFHSASILRERLMQVKTYNGLAQTLSECSVDEPYPQDALRAVRGKSGRSQKIVIPPEYLDARHSSDALCEDAELDISGG